MEGQQLFNGIITVGSVMGGWVLKTIWDTMKDLKQEVRTLALEVHQDFARRDDVKDAIREIKEMLVRIFDKLDDKADKGNQ